MRGLGLGGRFTTGETESSEEEGMVEWTEKVSQGTRQIKAGGEVAAHRHPEMEETLYVLKGSGIVTMTTIATPIAKGEAHPERA